MPFTDLQTEIATRLRRGEPLTQVEEEVIGPSSVTEDAKAALWLYGWCLLDEQARREEAPAHSGHRWSGRPAPGSAAPGQAGTRS
jgi:hypothetical protein